MNVEQLRLKNGLETLFIHSPGATSACVQIWFRAGSALEQKDNQGIAHFLEHMFFKGTPTRPGSLIAHEVESFGGEINAFTSFDYTCYYINTPVNYLEKTVEILLDMVSNPIFSQDDLVPERQVVFEEFRRSIDNPGQFNFKNMQETSFSTGYSHQILGTEKTILNFSKEQLTNFRNNHYNLSNALFVVAGDLKAQNKITALIEKHSMPKGQINKFPAFNLKSKATLNMHHKQVNQATITLAIQAPSYTDASAASEDLAVNCLAYGEISPLYKALVADTSVATHVSGSSMFFNKGGMHILKIALPEKNIKKALKHFTDTLANVIDRGYNENEVARIKSQYVASKIYEKESIESFAFSLGHGFAQTGNIYCEEEFIKEIKNAHIQQINHSLANIFARPIHLTVQLPQNFAKNSIKNDLITFQKRLNQFSTKHNANDKTTMYQASNFDKEVKVIEIKKGISLVYRQNSMTPTFVFHTYLKGGLAHETTANNGIYHFVSKLLTYGYGKIYFEELKNDLENKSAYLNGFSGKNAYGLTLHGLSENFSELMEHFYGTLFHPQFPIKYLKNEQELIKRVLLNYQEDPVKQCMKKVNELVFNNHPYALSSVGTENSIKKITKKGLENLHQERLANSEIVFTYCGDMDLDFVTDFVTRSIDKLKPRKITKSKAQKYRPIFGENVHIPFDREQSHIFIGRPAFAINSIEDLYLKMITTYLSGQSSELFVEVRDRQGLCYAVQPIHHTALEGGYWGIYIGAGKDKVEQAIAAIMEILNRLQQKGLSKKDFNRIKVMLDGQNQLNIQTNDDYANFYSIPVLHKLGLDYQHKSFELIRSFKHEDFNSFLAKFLKTDWNKIIVGPKD
jgi:zinc protease